MALLVGGVGVANTIVISVLERRAEVGLRRSLGATRGQIRTQFLTESLLLSVLGGTGGVLIGAAVTTGYALTRSWPAVVPAWAIAGGLVATLLIGAVAGLDDRRSHPDRRHPGASGPARRTAGSDPCLTTADYPPGDVVRGRSGAIRLVRCAGDS